MDGYDLGDRYMAKIIKKGRCEYRPVHSAVLSARISEEENTEPDQVSTFNTLLMVMEEEKPIQKEEKEDAEEGAVEAAREEAENILREAREQAEKIKEEAEQALREAHKNGEEIESLAYSLGFDQGKKDGEEIGRKQYLVMAQRLEKLIERISEGTEALLPQYESQMVEVAMNAARHIVDREIQISPEIVLESIRAAMAHVVQGSTVHLHLNPADIEAMEDKIKERFAAPGTQGLDIVKDPRIDRGGCLIETEFGLVDATTQAKWQAVSDTIKKILAERTGTALAHGKTGSGEGMDADEGQNVSEVTEHPEACGGGQTGNVLCRH